ncbi:MAG: acetoacetate decarboxylase family protein [Dehalococcoidia bacterium]
MPLTGTRDFSSLLREAPLLDGFGTEPWPLERAEILQVMFEIDDAVMTSLLPPALHPTIPPVAIFSVTRFPESPVGPFLLAQVRAGCRAGVRPRGFLLRAYADTGPACEALSSRWGFDCRPGEVALRRYHDRVEGRVRAGGRDVLSIAIIDPQAISGGDIQYVANMNLARTVESGKERGVLVQVDPEYTFHRAERGRPQVDVFDRDAWNAGGVDPVWPVSGCYALCDTGLPRIRYVSDPALPAIAGTRAVNKA